MSPSYYSNEENTDVTIRVEGNWLAYGEPHLIINEQVIQPHTKIDNQLEFLVPLDLYNDQSRINLFSPKLRLFQKRGWGRGPKQLEYQVGVFLVPDKMGTYSLSAKVEREEPIYTDRNEPFGDANGHCSGGRNIDWTFNAKGGEWRIDINSIKDKATHISTKSKYHGKRNVSEHSFQLHGRIENNGSCKKILGKVVTRDGRGVIRGQVGWKEYRMIPVTVDIGEVDKGTLFWNKDISIQLPKSLQSL